MGEQVCWDLNWNSNKQLYWGASLFGDCCCVGRILLLAPLLEFQQTISGYKFIYTRIPTCYELGVQVCFRFSLELQWTMVCKSVCRDLQCNSNKQWFGSENLLVEPYIVIPTSYGLGCKYACRDLCCNSNKLWFEGESLLVESFILIPKNYVLGVKVCLLSPSL